MGLNIKHRLAHKLHAIAWRLEPPPGPLFLKTDMPMTKEAACALADVLSGEIGGRVGLQYRGPDGTPGSIARF